MLFFLWISQTFAQQPSLPSVEQIQQYYSAGQYRQLINHLEQFLANDRHKLDTTRLRYLGAAYAQAGEYGKAIRTWKQAIAALRPLQDTESKKQLAALLNDQAQAYFNLGQIQNAISHLKEAIPLAEQQKAIELSIAAYNTLGSARLHQGQFESALNAYKTSLNLAQNNLPEMALTVLNNLTNTCNRMVQKYQKEKEFALQEEHRDRVESFAAKIQAAQTQARQNAQQALLLTQSSALKNSSAARALLNYLPFIDSPQQKINTLNQALAILNTLPNSQTKTYLLINLAEAAKSEERQIAFLNQAIQSAQAVGDSRGLSFALGELSNVYEASGSYQQALDYSQQAQNAAQPILAYDSLYRWQWQEGRIYHALQEKKLAKAAYRRAIASLQQIRTDLASATEDVQFDFQTQIEPIYREFLALLLENFPTDSAIQEARSIFDLLQVAQLENLFGDICLTVQTDLLPETIVSQTHSVLINSIILKNRFHIIVSFPNKQLRHYSYLIPQAEINKTIAQWRNDLETLIDNRYRKLANTLYELIVQPIESELTNIQPNQLIFINDGILRNVPMAALYNKSEKQHLIEKYPITTVLGLEFLSPERSLIDPKLLSFGLTTAKPPLFRADLPYVEPEINALKQELGGEQFIDEEFTAEQLKNQLRQEQPSIVHIATHGKFTGSQENTLIQAFDRPLSLKDLESILKQTPNPIELLTLSACQTSAGNDRAVLGLAGVAVRAGVRASVGSLWFVQDAAAAQLVSSFYHNLSQMGKVKALQQAQIQQIQQKQHPLNWSPFILIGT
ncbi:MAG: CHAT domain-containing protein [Hydrococcus sp. Prado102]|jgi:CHAT domain-containing protein|nr:CHAT domain-containing protein [Hydrococcus sp. Prado102]